MYEPDYIITPNWECVRVRHPMHTCEVGNPCLTCKGSHPEQGLKEKMDVRDRASNLSNKE